MERRRGRRDNGLDASEFAAVGDIDPRLAEHLLDMLAARGIAAYLQPSMDVNPITRSTTVPPRPTDRLYADRAHLGTARDYLRQLAAEEGTSSSPSSGQDTDPPRPEEPAAAASSEPPAQPPSRPATEPSNLDATFAGIVAAYDRPVDPTAAPPWPSAENVPAHDEAPASESEPPSPPESPEPAAPSEPPRRPADGRHLTEDSLLEGLDTFDTELPPTESDERFVPPPPPPLPRLSRQAVLGGLAILIGLVLVLAPEAVPLGRGDATWLGFAAILGGAVALILRLRPGTDPEEEQRPDDGAQV